MREVCSISRAFWSFTTATTKGPRPIRRTARAPTFWERRTAWPRSSADAGYDAGTVGIGSDLYGAVAEIADFAPDVVFNLCESIDGASNLEPLLPLLLERAGLAYTGSSPLTLGLAVHKHKAKDVLRGAGVPTPEAAVLTTPDVSKVALGFPLIVKPAREDASVGITTDSVVHDRAALERQVTFVLARYLQPALVESYIEGREIYVSLLGRPEGGVQILPLYEIDFSEMPAGCPRIVSFDGKWVESSPEFRGHQAGPLRGAVGGDPGPDRRGRRDGVRGHGAARLRPSGCAPVGRRHAVRHRREPQLRPVGRGRVRARRTRRRARI